MPAQNKDLLFPTQSAASVTVSIFQEIFFPPVNMCLFKGKNKLYPSEAKLSGFDLEVSHMSA